MPLIRNLTEGSETIVQCAISKERSYNLEDVVIFDLNTVFCEYNDKFSPPQSPDWQGESAHSGSLECLFPFRQSEEQPIGTEDSASGTRNWRDTRWTSPHSTRLDSPNKAKWRSTDGSTLLTEKTQILQRWVQHFRGVLNRLSAIFDAAIERLPQVETNVDLDLPPSLQETISAVQQLSRGKTPGSDTIPAEVYKHGGHQLMDHLTALFQQMWRQDEVPQDFKDATIVHLFMRKWNRQFCENHRGISLLNIAGKIFA
nr:unnamed protein product [Spirometra erinaceieuropaei]